MNDETPETLLKGALERIVYFEARSTQLANDVERSVAEAERLKAELARAAQREIELKRTVAELEVRASRAEAQREETALLVNALRRERADLVTNFLDASRLRGTEVVEGVDLAQFIAQLRSEVLHARDGDAPGAGPTLVAKAASDTSASSASAGPATKKPTVTEGTPATRLALELRSAGRLSVSEADVNTLTDGAAFPGHSEETLFGFSVRELSSRDVAARVRAAERLAALAHRAAAPALATALNVELEAPAQVAMLKALTTLAGPEGAPVVQRLLDAPSAEVRIAALKALLKLDPAGAGPHLAAATSDPEPAVRRRASLLALGLGPKEALELGTTAIHDGDAAVRALAALVLGASQADAARPLLLEAMRDADLKVRRSASQALSNLLGQDVTQMVELTDSHRRREVRRLASVEPLAASARRARPAPALGTTPATQATSAVPTTPAPAPAPPRSPEAQPEAPNALGKETSRAPAAQAAPRAPSARAVTFLASTPSTAVAAVAASPAASMAAGARTAVATVVASAPRGDAALGARLLGELRTSLRGKSLPELAEGAGAPADEVRGGLSALLSSGAVVRRGLKYFVA